MKNNVQNKHFLNLKRILDNPEKALRLYLFDAKRHRENNALQKWETDEAGSIQGMRNGYHVLVESIDENLSQEIIETIRNALIKDNIYGNSDIQRYGVNATTIATKVSLKNISQDKIDKLNDDAKELQQNLEMNNLPYWLRDDILRTPKSDKELYLNKIIERYHQKNSSANAQYDNQEIDIEVYNAQIFENILVLVRDLERSHPYPDFNCRTFCVLILDRELVKHSYSPCIMEDNNVFDYASLEELNELVKNGQKNFAYLMSHNVVHEGDPDNQEWYKALKSEDTDDLLKIAKNLKDMAKEKSIWGRIQEFVVHVWEDIVCLLGNNDETEDSYKKQGLIAASDKVDKCCTASVNNEFAKVELLGAGSEG